jgi:hypothetical protein
MSGIEELEIDASVIEGYFFKDANSIRNLLFESDYNNLNLYLKSHADSLKHDLDLLLEKSGKIVELENSASHPI